MIFFDFDLGYVYMSTYDPLWWSGGAVGPCRQDLLQRRKDLLVSGAGTISGHGHAEGFDADGSPQFPFDVWQQNGVASCPVQPQVDQRFFDVLSKVVVHCGGAQC